MNISSAFRGKKCEEHRENEEVEVRENEQKKDMYRSENCNNIITDYSIEDYLTVNFNSN